MSLPAQYDYAFAVSPGAGSGPSQPCTTSGITAYQPSDAVHIVGRATVGTDGTGTNAQLWITDNDEVGATIGGITTITFPNTNTDVVWPISVEVVDDRPGSAERSYILNIQVPDAADDCPMGTAVIIARTGTAVPAT